MQAYLVHVELLDRVLVHLKLPGEILLLQYAQKKELQYAMQSVQSHPIHKQQSTPSNVILLTIIPDLPRPRTMCSFCCRTIVKFCNGGDWACMQRASLPDRCCSEKMMSS